MVERNRSERKTNGGDEGDRARPGQRGHSFGFVGDRRSGEGAGRRQAGDRGSHRQRSVRGRRDVHPLRRPTRRRAVCRRPGPLPLAPRNLRPHHRRGGRSARVEPAEGLRVGRTGRTGLCNRPGRCPCPRPKATGHSRIGGDRRLRSSRGCRRRDAASSRLHRPGHHGRARGAGRSTQCLQGLSRRHGSRGVDAAPQSGLLRRA